MRRSTGSGVFHSAARRSPAWPAWLAGSVLVLLTAPTRAEDDGSPRAPLSSYLRVVEDANQRVALEVATRRFVPADGRGPEVALVAVAHLGEAAFYEKLQDRLDGFDVVLYESVLPAGAAGAEGESDETRIDSTRAAMSFVASLVELYRRQHGAYPADLQALTAYVADLDQRLAGWNEAASRDAWSRPIQYAVQAPAPEQESLEQPAGEGRFTLISLGADGELGGIGVAGDLIVTSDDRIEPFQRASEDNLQAQLAQALDLAFQLEAIDYQQPNWRCSDLAMDQLNRALRARGIDFIGFSSTLAGSSMPAQVIKMILRFTRWADAFLGGAIADTLKVAMIEMLGDDVIMQQSLEQMGEGFSEVIVDLRNSKTIEDLRQIIKEEPEIGSVAIFYGAAHMPDFEQQLAEKLGYRPLLASATDPTISAAPEWLKAIEVDLTSSAISASELQQMRVMIRRALKQQFPRRR